MGQHVLQAYHQNVGHGLLVAEVSLWFGRIRVRVAVHKKRNPMGALADGRDNILYC